MNDFEYFAPKTLEETLSLLKPGKQSVKILAGGTDLIVQMKDNRASPDIVIDAKKVQELNHLELTGNGTLRIGAAVPLGKIVAFTPLVENFNILYQGCSLIGSVQVRNRATMGGNICNAAPSADSAPPLICLRAQAVIAGPKGTRELPVEKFFNGPGQTALANSEVLVEVRIPPAPAHSAGAYMRHIPRQEMDIANTGVGVILVMDPDSKTCQEARITLGAVAPTPIRATAAEKSLTGKVIDDGAIRQAGDLAAGAAKPISDVRASAEYRLELVRVLTRRTIKAACRLLNIEV